MKLKKLILSGFKSFADRTEFNFDEGVTCVVGPNGCGKSNVVDAVRWVLGEQSAKSLRGSEMSDVIFNGTTTRRGAGCAEVVLVFDNSGEVLRLEGRAEVAPDGLVSVGRRLYRNGASEYLINKTPCRLKDIREMFMDTGIGVDAYSIIEQGRVEMFLQGSQDDRRAIFDEAAGISKYKARKKEALRKLEHVEQDLLRLGDIVAEVEKRLRSIKYQASRARSYQEHSQRLRELRTLWMLSQYHKHALQRTGLQKQVDAAKDGLASVQTRIDQLEGSGTACEVELLDIDASAREVQARLAVVGTQLTTRQERIELLSRHVEELQQQVLTAASRGEEMEAKIVSVQQEREGRCGECGDLDRQIAELSSGAEAIRREHAEGEARIEALQEKVEDEKAGILDLMRRTSDLHNEIHAHGLRRESLHGQKARLDGRAGEIAKALENMLVDRAMAEEHLGDIEQAVKDSTSSLDQARQDAKDVGARERELQAQLASDREQRAALTARMETLREMQQRHEGVSDSVRRVLAACQEGRLPAVAGMLGDLIQSDPEGASLIEAALAGADQFLVARRFDETVQSAGLLAEILGGQGSVEVLSMDRLAALPQGESPDAAAPAGLTPILNHVRCEEWVSPAARYLLGRTYVAQTVEEAARAASAAPLCRFVTRGGDVLEADGRIRLGAARRAAGVITRQSELTQLGEELARLDPRIEELQQQCLASQQESRHLEELQQKLRTSVYEATTERLECQRRLESLAQDLSRLERERPIVAEDLQNLLREMETTAAGEARAKAQADEMGARSAERQRQTDLLNQEVAAARSEQGARTQKLTEFQVSLAQKQEKKRSLQEAIDSLARQGQQMEADLAALRAVAAATRQRKAETVESIRLAKDEAEKLFTDKTALDRDVQELEESRKGLQEKLQDSRRELAARREESQAASDALAARRSELAEVDVRVENLISRAGEEMQINLLEQSATYQHDESRDWAAVEADMQDLRGKLERLGTVNLDAISEQEELTKRQEFLTTQLADVRASRDQLHDLIRRINRESREIFLKTFTAVRENFQELFRKLFGGGRADVYLVDENDVLESGIEIVARPPGKELRSLTLLSGGEKAMTAVALLFSIFRTRPSPFCVLDEVDAALDEANNERFNLLIQEFIGTSQFLVISHSKRTMSMGSVLYGVTMQEPGVSTRIAVRFEDAGHRLQQEAAVAGA
jgi:chromosome segregation protein